VTAVRNKQFRYRERSSGRRKTRFVVGLLALALVVGGSYVVQRDVRIDRVLASRGVAATGTLADKGCWACRAVAVTYTTSGGQKVSTVVTALGPQKDTTIALKYDPQHPATVHPAKGVREEEGIAAGAVVLGLLVLLFFTGLLRRRGRRRGQRVRTRSLASQDATGHVRLV
jgi:hypothetical protein